MDRILLLAIFPQMVNITCFLLSIPWVQLVLLLLILEWSLSMQVYIFIIARPIEFKRG